MEELSLEVSAYEEKVKNTQFVGDSSSDSHPDTNIEIRCPRSIGKVKPNLLSCFSASFLKSEISADSGYSVKCEALEEITCTCLAVPMPLERCLLEGTATQQTLT